MIVQFSSYEEVAGRKLRCVRHVSFYKESREVYLKSEHLRTLNQCLISRVTSGQHPYLERGMKCVRLQNMTATSAGTPHSASKLFSENLVARESDNDLTY
jgi:hypothetical protein